MKLPAVHWGIHLSSGHLASLGLEKVDGSSAFHRIEKLASRLVLLPLTADAEDTLREGFDEKLQAARQALAPLLIDSSGIELTE